MSRKSYFAGAISRGSYNFYVAGAVLLKHLQYLKIAKTYWTSEVKCLVDISFSKEVSQKSFAFELQSFIFEGSLAKKFRFWGSNFDFIEKPQIRPLLDLKSCGNQVV